MIALFSKKDSLSCNPDSSRVQNSIKPFDPALSHMSPRGVVVLYPQFRGCYHCQQGRWKQQKLLKFQYFSLSYRVSHRRKHCLQVHRLTNLKSQIEIHFTYRFILILSSCLRLALNLLNPSHATCPLSLIFLNFTMVITFGEERQSWGSILCNFFFLSPATSLLFTHTKISLIHVLNSSLCTCCVHDTEHMMPTPQHLSYSENFKIWWTVSTTCDHMQCTCRSSVCNEYNVNLQQEHQNLQDMQNYIVLIWKIQAYIPCYQTYP